MRVEVLYVSAYCGQQLKSMETQARYLFYRGTETVLTVRMTLSTVACDVLHIVSWDSVIHHETRDTRGDTC